jgi:hypothetical protein
VRLAQALSQNRQAGPGPVRSSTWAQPGGLAAPSTSVPCSAMSAAEGPILAATLAIRQRGVPADRYAQTAATAASLMTGAYALGAAVAGLLAGALTARQLVLLVGIGQLLALAPFLGRRGRRCREGAAAEVSFID